MKYKFLLCSFCAMVALTPTPTSAQIQQCDQRSKIVSHLERKYQEVPAAIGVTTSGGMVEVLTSGDGGTWTIILSNPNGTSCLVAAGEGWRFLKPDHTKLDPQT